MIGNRMTIIYKKHTDSLVLLRLFCFLIPKVDMYAPKYLLCHNGYRYFNVIYQFKSMLNGAQNMKFDFDGFRQITKNKIFLQIYMEMMIIDD